jgi:hypothetical protein
MSYHNVKNIAEAELAGCLPVVEDPNNFDVLRDNLTMRIALYYKRSAAEELSESISIEAYDVKVTVPHWEYIINELQYEFRVAAAHGVDNLKVENENRLINEWARYIIKRDDLDTALDFIAILKANRVKRKR